MPVLTTLALSLLSLADPPSPIDVASAMETATIEAIAKARPSVVAITRVRGDDPEKTSAIRGQNGDRPARNPKVAPNGELRAGSPGDFRTAPGDFSAGVVIGDGGEILTTFHTLKGAEAIWVRGADRQEFEAEILGADPRSDLAVIAPRDPGEVGPRLATIRMGNATRLRPGAFLVALGNSYNAARDGKASASMGILANTARKVHASDDDTVGDRGKFFRFQPTLLQLDAKLNLGMSGGAVINLKGELVGLTTAAASAVAYDLQAGYAIPMDDLGRRIAETLRQGKEVEYGFLGISLEPNTPNQVAQVRPGTPADRADLVEGDLILAVGDHPLDEDDALTMALANVPVGQSVALKVLRSGKTLEKAIMVSKYPVSPRGIVTNRPRPWRGLRIDFTSTLGAGGFNADIMGAMSRGGIGVIEVEPGSPAEQAGLKKDMILTEVDGQAVATPAEFARAVSHKDGQEVTITTQGGPIAGQKVVVKK